MKNFLTLLFIGFLSSVFAHFTETHSHSVQLKNDQSYEWEIQNTKAFNELLLSWSSPRPEKGSYKFYVALKDKDWTDWMSYAEWGENVQKTFSSKTSDSFAKNFQDTTEVQEGKTAKGFRIKVIAQNGASLKNLKSLYVCTSNLNHYFISDIKHSLKNLLIDNVQGQSQMALPHPRSRDLCSPTSTSTVVNFLSGEKIVKTTEFAEKVRDQEFDIYGNWALNVAEANNILQESPWECHIERLISFEDLYKHLKMNTPVVVSIKGDLTKIGAPVPYKSGHLMVVVGFDSENNKVLCVDSALDKDEKTFISYDLKDFLRVWGVRKNLAYIFSKK